MVHFSVCMGGENHSKISRDEASSDYIEKMLFGVS